MNKICVASVFALVSHLAMAQVSSPSAMEVTLSYTASFVSDDTSQSRKDLAAFHASHLFGLFQSAELVAENGLDDDLVAGVGVPYLPQDIKVLSVKNVDGGREIKYSVETKALIQKDVARKWLKKGKITLPLPYDMAKIYDVQCTDKDYPTEGDYWYFYDVYRTKCEYLQSEPYARQVSIRVSKGPTAYSQPAPLEALRENSEFSIYVIHGFSDSASKRHDDGRKDFNEFNEFLISRGFEESVERKDPRRPLDTFEKTLTDANGRDIHVVIQSLLVDTAAESRGVTFAKFFKEAVEEADVVLYAGHSGLGGNLDIPTLEDKAGKFHAAKKAQLFFFDSCSSYSYYLDTFKDLKKNSPVAVISNGLESEFGVSEKVHEAFIDALMEAQPDTSWRGLLSKLEEPLHGGSYLINVGGN